MAQKEKQVSEQEQAGEVQIEPITYLQEFRIRAPLPQTPEHTKRGDAIPEPQLDPPPSQEKQS